MTVVVDLKRCNGCRHMDEPQCEKLCPGDLMALNRDTGKAYIREPRDCWDCMVCVKACPMRAIETRLPYPLALYGASLKPRVKGDRIIWTLKDARGNVETFELQTRTPGR
ncbi:MAG: 4Fe-4S ferredoxin [Methanobacteriota archaeon]|nr:MAG: 4Fe-4S ferredoxin [Euryarchaeota archaeon]